MRNCAYLVVLAVPVLLLSACAGQREPLIDEFALPERWRAEVPEGSPDADWLGAVGAGDLIGLVEQALEENYALRQQALAVEASLQQVRVAGAELWPSLSLGASGRRNRTVFQQGFDQRQLGVINEQVDVSADVGLELDIWGRLRDAQRQAVLQLGAEEMNFLLARRSLVAQVLSGAFTLTAAVELERVVLERLENLRAGLDVIERGYRSGLNSALDVYLARNSVEQEMANLAAQQQARYEAATALERLVSDYPDGDLVVDLPLPEVDVLPSAGIPSDLLKRRPDIQSAWLDLLASDAALAVAHKNRFPMLNLSGSLSDSAPNVDTLIEGGPLAFRVSASLLQPIFQGGRLRALERQARIRVEQAEQRYLQVVFDALAEVENALSNGQKLHGRYTASVQARENAEAALALASDQYERGLVTYTTVLEAQRRAFDAQTAVVQLASQAAQNRVRLLLALGGDFQTREEDT